MIHPDPVNSIGADPLPGRPGVARAQPLGRTTQVWDAVVTHRESGRILALFRCTQMLLFPRPGTP